MRPTVLFAAVASLVLAAASLHAGRLDVAVIEYTDARDLDAMSAALAGADLVKITDSDRTETKAPELTGGWVLFTQSLGVAAGGRFATSTRLKNQRADVSGSLNGTNLSLQITLLDGVKVGIRKFTERTFEGNGSVAGGVPRIVAVRQSSGKTIGLNRNRTAATQYVDFTTIIVAQYRP